ncbi:MAG: radical SAM protein [Candidatus Omnitrophota bacterium]|nr:radical SAM protein [Candidatus Omnitrophota bacterium]
MKYIYGPVDSRRLGLSLGISIIPHKTCNFDCLYCQLGRTATSVNIRKEYVDIEEALCELKTWLKDNAAAAEKLRYLTISGSGEPTLNIKIGQLIAEIKKITPIAVAVITNGSLLSDPQARQDLLRADLVVPSLDAAEEAAFARIDRPHPQIKLEQVIDGLAAFRKEFRGKIWLEVMLVAGVNDAPAQIKKLKEVIDKINPDKIQLNSPVRCTAEKNILPVKKEKFEKFREILGDKCEVV